MAPNTPLASSRNVRTPRQAAKLLRCWKYHRGHLAERRSRNMSHRPLAKYDSLQRIQHRQSKRARSTPSAKMELERTLRKRYELRPGWCVPPAGAARLPAGMAPNTPLASSRNVRTPRQAAKLLRCWKHHRGHLAERRGRNMSHRPFANTHSSPRIITCNQPLMPSLLFSSSFSCFGPRSFATASMSLMRLS